MYEGYDPSAYIAANPEALTMEKALEIVQANSSNLNADITDVNDLIITPRGSFNTHPADYIFAMQNPAAPVNEEMRNEVRTVERIPQAAPPVVVEGEIELRSELVIDDKGYRLKQAVGKNTTPYKFTVGSAMDARRIQ
jgi:hypothetical protein